MNAVVNFEKNWGRPKRKRILIADANALLRDFLEYILARQGYDVLSAVDGDQAKQLILSEHLDLVILDLMLPGAGGHKLLSFISETPDLAAIHVFVVSDKSGEEDIVSAFRMGAADYLVKPFIRTELISRIDRLFRNRASECLKIPSQSPKPALAWFSETIPSNWRPAATKIGIEKERKPIRALQTLPQPTKVVKACVTLRQFSEALNAREVEPRRRMTLRQFSQDFMTAALTED